MQFKNHLFISYAHLDNQHLQPGQEGWVSRFHGTLKPLLDTRLGHAAQIWCDESLVGNDVFENEIIQALPRAAILVSIVSKSYLESKWCLREIQEFCKSALGSTGLAVGNKLRVFKVLKLPVPLENPLPDPVKNTLGFPFYTSKDGAAVELDPAFGPDMASQFNLTVALLASRLADTIEEIAAIQDPVAAPAAARKGLVYLAECSWDLVTVRRQMEAELRGAGYDVVPDCAVPARNDEEYAGEVARMLDGCDLSIHLVSEMIGAVPDGKSQQSCTAIQNSVAVQQSKARGLPRIVWLPEGTASQNPSHQQFIDALRRDNECQFGADLISGDLGVLKETVLLTLRRMEKPQPAAEPAGAPAPGGKMIYIICDERDREATIPLRKALKEQGLIAKIPLFQAAAADIRASNDDLLARCDGVILFYGAGDESWKLAKDNDLLRNLAKRGKQEQPPVYTYLAQPQTAEKHELIELEEKVIDGLQEFSPSDLQTFLGALRQSGRSTGAGL